jgi:hypothetical protein
VRVTGAAVHLLPVPMRVPLKFGGQTLDAVTCARATVEVRTRDGHRGVGRGETPLSVAWGWPSSLLPHAVREEAMVRLVIACARSLVGFGEPGHALELGHAFRENALAGLAEEAAAGIEGGMPELAALICSSPLDLALHDAFGHALGLDTYATYGPEHLSQDLADLLGPDAGQAGRRLRGRHPADFLVARPASDLLAWHLVGGLDPLSDDELAGREPRDGHPVLLADWIVRDGLRCLKIKLRGDDLPWDVARLLRVGRIGLALGVRHLCADFNCTVGDPAYVHAALDAVAAAEPAVMERLLYVEQPFPADLTAHPIDVHALAARTRLFLDESAHDWRHIEVGRGLGWNGVALKTCKTQSEALLALAWARTHGLDVMVQDLTNPMLAAIPHVRLAAHADTLAGVETNAMQFYPDASAAEAAVHPGLYRRHDGRVSLASLAGPGFGMRVDEIDRTLPEPVAAFGSIEPFRDR